MLSILIPAYNHDCRPLARSLSQQADSLSCPVEIIVADDGSDDTRLRSLNAEIAALPHCRYIMREENVGRATIRNFLTTATSSAVASSTPSSSSPPTTACATTTNAAPNSASRLRPGSRTQNCPSAPSAS